MNAFTEIPGPFNSEITDFQPFKKEVNGLVQQLLDLLQDTMKMNLFLHDPEMIADLRLSVSKNCFNSPDLRYTWLSALATFQRENGNLAEAAMCYLHIAALISDYLRIQNPSANTPKAGYLAFITMSSNITVENIESYFKDKSLVPQSLKLNEGLFQESLHVTFIQFSTCSFFQIAALTHQIHFRI